jgi:hypothetical protein
MEQLLQSVQHLDQRGRHGRREARGEIGRKDGVQVPNYLGNMGI